MKRKRRLSKRDAQVVHSQRRAIERYRLYLSEADIQGIVRGIQKKNSIKAVFLKRQSERVTLWMVEWKGQNLFVCYDNTRQSISTVLPPSEPLKVRLQEATLGT